ncbi:MAG: hypothetical protein ACLSCX_03395 [Oscillospiraceae bacterium]
MERTNFYDAIYSPVVLLLNAVVVGIVMLLSASGNARILSLFGMSVGTSVAVINYISRIFAPIESLGMEIQTIQSAMAGVRRIDAFLAQPERAMENGETAAYGDVVLSHVTFGYGEAPVLRDFSMTVKQGEQITLGDPQITEEMAKHAARLAGIDAAVQALPEGYHTVCTEGCSHRAVAAAVHRARCGGKSCRAASRRDHGKSGRRNRTARACRTAPRLRRAHRTFRLTPHLRKSRRQNHRNRVPAEYRAVPCVNCG